MTGPSSAPRGERAGTPGAGWETELRSTGERYVPDGELEPRANRAARRAARRGQKPTGGRETSWRGLVGLQEAREGPWTPVSGPKSVQRSRSHTEPENASENFDPVPPTRTETR